MKSYGWFKEIHEKVKDSFEYKLAGMEIEVTEQIVEMMEKRDINRSELAKKLGVSKASITRLLNDGSNITLKRILAISEALEFKLNFNFVDKHQQSARRVACTLNEGDLFEKSTYSFHQNNIRYKIADDYTVNVGVIDDALHAA